MIPKMFPIREMFPIRGKGLNEAELGEAIEEVMDDPRLRFTPVEKKIRARYGY